MSINLHYGKPESYDYNTILDQLSGTKVNSIKTSSVPLAEFWKETNTHLSELLNHLGISTDSNIQLCFEYPTTPKKGKGKASMTDLMILHGDTKIAIESKFREYKEIKNEKNIGDWLKKNPENRSKVLSYWDDLIKPFSNKIEEINKLEIESQFYHRTASACYNSKNAIVVYQVFYDEETLPYLENFINKLRSYKSSINPNERLRFFIWKVKANLLKPETKKDDAFYEMKNEQIYDFSDSLLFEI